MSQTLVGRIRDAWSSFLWRRLGFIELSRRDGLRLTWLQIILSPGIGAKATLWRRDDDRWQWGLYLHPLIFQIYLNLWWSKKDWPNEDYSGHLWWGFDWAWNREWHSTFWFGWPGKNTTLYYLPWAWDHIGTWVLMEKDGWLPDNNRSCLSDRFDGYLSPWDRPGVYVETLPYRYLLKSGVVQERIAKVRGEKMEWRWRISKQLGLRWPRMVRTCIQVEFNEEVGERSGSWKGGCIGCSWDWKDGQTFQEALWNMESKRKF